MAALRQNLGCKDKRILKPVTKKDSRKQKRPLPKEEQK